jgi:P27 family predicted phage terminase small subunit
MMRGVKPRLITSDGKVTGEPPSPVPPPPSWLPKTAKDEWRKVIPDLIARVGLKDTDQAALANYCVAIARVQECAKLLNRGSILRAPGKPPKAHPAVRIQHQFLETARRYAAELGLTPVSRQRAAGGASKPGESADDDPWA